MVHAILEINNNNNYNFYCYDFFVIRISVNTLYMSGRFLEVSFFEKLGKTAFLAQFIRSLINSRFCRNRLAPINSLGQGSGVARPLPA
jgi:hypothetical protein